MEIYTEFGNKLKMNIPSIEKLIKIVNGKVKNGDLNGFDYGDLKILGINPAKKIFTIDYNNINIDLNYTLSAGNNISNVFNTAKDYKNKIEGAERAIEETKKINNKGKGKGKSEKKGQGTGLKHTDGSFHPMAIWSFQERMQRQMRNLSKSTWRIMIYMYMPIFMVPQAR